LLRELLRAGATIQSASALTLLVQNILAPHLLGAHAYGMAVATLALPSLVQGFLEPMAIGAAIASRRSARWTAALRLIGRDTLIAGAAAVLLFLVFAKTRQIGVGHAVAAAMFLSLALLNTFLKAIAFAQQLQRTIVWHYLIALFVSCVSIPVLSKYGSVGYLLALCAVQIGVLAVFLCNLQVLSLLKEIRGHKSGGNEMNWRHVAAPYTSNLMPRLAQIVMGSLIVFIASIQLSPSGLAQFRVTLTLVNGVTYLIPLAAPMLQARIAAAGGIRAAIGTSHYVWVRALLGIAAMLIVSSIVMFLYSRQLTKLVLVESGVGDSFANMLLAAPAYALLPLLAAIALGDEAHRPMIIGTALLSLGVVALGVIAGGEAGFIFGSAAFASWYGSVAFRRLRRAPQC